MLVVDADPDLEHAGFIVEAAAAGRRLSLPGSGNRSTKSVLVDRCLIGDGLRYFDLTMHRIVCIVGAVGLVGCGTAALMAGCGSDDAAAIGDGADASEASSSSSSSSGTASSSSGGSSTSSSGGTTDAGADALDPPTDGAAGGGDATTNPTKVTCGASECTTPTQVCCQTFNDAGCIAANDTCNGIKSGCDEKADCQGNEICCASFNTTTTCATSCSGGYQICKSASECDSGTCKEWSCPANQKVRACEKPFAGCN